MELNFNEFFTAPLYAMKINGADPFIKKDIKWLIKFLIIHGIYTLVFLLIVYNIIYVNLKQNNFSETCKNGVLTVVFCAITFQYSVMVINQEPLKLLMNIIKKDYLFAKSLSVKEQEIVYEFAMKGNHVCNQWLFMTTIGAALFPIKNLLLISISWVAKEEIVLIPLYDLVYPAFIENVKDNIAVYTITYITMLGYAVYSSIMYCAFVPLGPIFILHACGQIELVKIRVDSLFECEDPEEVRQNLNNIVKQLQKVYYFVDVIQSCFTIAYEMTLKITTILLPITSYEVLESLKHGDVSLEFLIFIVGGLLFSSSPCFYGNLLMEKGEDLRMAVYCCGWERVYDRGIRNTMMIILQRASRPVAIRTLFRILCLDALTDLLQQSYTIFNLMNAAWN